MNNESIKVGDLVAVVRWPCCGKGLGRIAKVVRPLSNPFGRRSPCSICGVDSHEQHGFRLSDGWGVPTAWLKRIPPLEELEGEKTDTPIVHEITA